MKKQIVKDERVLTLRRKIQSDAFQIIIIGLLVSILIQQYVFKAQFPQYAVEAVMLIAASIYVVVCNLMVGNDIFDSTKSSRKLVIISSLVCGGAVAVVSAVLNENLFKAGNLSAVFVVVVTFLSATFTSFVVLEFFYRANKKKQESLEAKLNDDDTFE